MFNKWVKICLSGLNQSMFWQKLFFYFIHLSSPSCLDSPRNTAVSVSPAGELQDRLPVTLTCSSDANPPVHTYTWYQGAGCLPSADKSFHPARQSLATPTGRGRTLSTANITAEEYGQHCCVARNRHGSQTDSVTLRSSRGTWMTRTPGAESELCTFFSGIHVPAEGSPRVTPHQT